MTSPDPKPDETLLEQWRQRVREVQYVHYEAARVYETYNYWLGIPVIVLSTFVGTSVFATLGESIKPSTQILVGFVSVAAGVLASLQTFLGFSERAEKHRAAGAQFGSLSRKIHQRLKVGEKPVPYDEISSLRIQYDRLVKDAPNLSARIWGRSRPDIETLRQERWPH